MQAPTSPLDARWVDAFVRADHNGSKEGPLKFVFNLDVGVKELLAVQLTNFAFLDIDSSHWGREWLPGGQQGAPINTAVAVGATSVTVRHGGTGTSAGDGGARYKIGDVIEFPVSHIGRYKIVNIVADRLDIERDVDYPCAPTNDPSGGIRVAMDSPGDEPIARYWTIDTNKSLPKKTNCVLLHIKNIPGELKSNVASASGAFGCLFLPPNSNADVRSYYNDMNMWPLPHYNDGYWYGHERKQDEPLCSTEITGSNRWIKTLEFTLSDLDGNTIAVTSKHGDESQCYLWLRLLVKHG